MIVRLLLLLLLVPAASEAATYYVAQSGGDNTRSCTTAQTLATPKLTIVSGMACLTQPGDILYIRTGTYNETPNLNGKNGNAGAYITISNYQSEVVTIRATSGNWVIAPEIMTASYLILNGLIFDGVNQGSAPTGNTTGFGPKFHNGSHHITFQNLEFKNMYGHIFIGSNVAGTYPRDLRFTNVSIHDSRTDCVLGRRWYGIYLGTGHRITIEDSQIFNTAGGAIQNYPGGLDGIRDVVIRRNTIHDGVKCSTANTGAIITGTQTGMSPNATNIGTQIYSNVIYHTGQGASLDGPPLVAVPGVQTFGAPDQTKIWNNTIYNNKGQGIRNGTAATNTVIQNNLVTGNQGIAVDQGAPATVSHNACTSAENCGTTTSNKQTISGIGACAVNAASADFHLSPGSPCINTGLTISAVTMDRDRVPRPQGTAYDIGAYEYGGATPPPDLPPGPPSNIIISWLRSEIPDA